MEELKSIPSYPLQWPEGWARAATQERSRFGKFSKPVSIGAATDFVISELGRMGIPSWNIIISSDLRLRNDGLPYSNQRNPEDVGVSIWWRIDNARKVIALDKYDRIGDNIYAIGKTIEAMRGIDRWGSGEILERTFEGFEALPNPDNFNWRDTLSYYGHDMSELKRHYHVAMRLSHPDAGGNDEQAAAVNQAYDIGKKELR